MDTLKLLRSEKSLSQQQLADILGVSRSTIAMWETGGSQPDNASLNALADFFTVSIDYILGRVDERKPTLNKEDGLDELDKKLIEILGHLTPEQKQMLLAQIEFQLQKPR